MKRHFLTVLVIVLLMLAAAALPAAADGVVVITPPDSDPPQPMPAATPGKAPVVGPMPPLPPPQPPYLSVKYHRVEVSIRDQVALTKVDQVFVNDYNVDLEGTYIFPLPEDAAISNFSMYVDGKKWEGKLLTKEEARRIYEDTVRSKRDPALLEYIGRGAFQARVYPIPARGERRIQIEYTQVLPRENDLVRYIYPLATEKLSPQAL